MKDKTLKNEKKTKKNLATLTAKAETLETIHKDHIKEEDKKPRPDACASLEAKINEHLHHKKENKHNVLNPCDTEHESCSCNRSTSDKNKVDLVVLIDASGSMGSAAKAILAAAEGAVEAAAKECPSDLRVSWLAVDGKKPGANPSGNLGDITGVLTGTKFTQTHQQYLESIGSTGPFKQDEPQPVGDTTYPGEEGADSIADICNFYDWRENACKSIFYVSDTALDGYSSFYDAAATNATAAAISNGVVLFAHKITPGADNSSGVIASYDNLTLPTGGSAYHGPVNKEQYKVLIKEAICNACGAECKEVELPVIEPCVSIAWGNSDCDCFETDDVEVATLSICNCYSNITFSKVRISYLHITMADGSPVPLMPDGSPSVQIVPVGPICFGEVGPCKEGGTNCVSREVVIRTRGAKSGKYKIHVRGICYEVVLNQMHEACFELELCKD